MLTRIILTGILLAGVSVVVRAQETPATDQERSQAGTLLGEVRAAPDSQPIQGAHIEVAGMIGEVRPDIRGRFSLTLVPGTYSLTVRALGYSQKTFANIELQDADTTFLALLLDPAPLRLSDIVVTPSTFGILEEETVKGQQTLTRDEVHTQPHIGEDVFRVVDRLPGLATHDATAKFAIRGAPNDQVLTMLDGLEVHEPFHLKDWDGSLSIVDIESVDRVNLTTGGFTAEYGDKMAGLFLMTTTTPPPDRIRTTLGFTIMNLTFKSEGGFSGGKGTWLASARYGFLKPVLKILNEGDGAEPTFYDVFGKMQYQLSQRHIVSGHVLHAGDDFAIVENDDGTEVTSAWGSSYAWVNWRAEWTPTIFARTTLSAGTVSRNRRGIDYNDANAVWLRVNDLGDFDFYGLRQDWSAAATDRLLVKWGFDLKHGVADYDYWRRAVVGYLDTSDPTNPVLRSQVDTLAVAVRPSGQELTLYQANRFRLIDRLTAELGVRYDHYSHTGDNVISPRVNVALEITPRTTLRGAWGHFHQSHGLDELAVADGDLTFYPVQRAEHRVLGLEYESESGTKLRVEAYERRIADPRPEYRMLIPDVQPFPEEVPADRARVEPSSSYARGIEFLATGNVQRRFAWWASYACAVARDEIEGEWTPRPHDQRHTVQLGFTYRPTRRWSFSSAWQYHTGWPATAKFFDFTTLGDGSTVITSHFGPLYADRLPAYHRLDLRASSGFPVGSGWMEVFLDVFNAYNRENAEALSYSLVPTPGGLAVDRGINPLLSVLPTVGFRLEF